MAIPELTPAQLLVFKNDILADGILGVLPQTVANAMVIRDAYNLEASPAFWSRTHALTKALVYFSTSVDATTWDWTLYKNLSVAEKETWLELFSQGSIDTQLPNVYDSVITKILQGAGVADLRTHFAAISRHKLSRFERLFATGVGTPASPGADPVHGPCLAGDVYLAWGA